MEKAFDCVEHELISVTQRDFALENSSYSRSKLYGLMSKAVILTMDSPPVIIKSIEAQNKVIPCLHIFSFLALEILFIQVRSDKNIGGFNSILDEVWDTHIMDGDRKAPPPSLQV